jgi:hypothetical protein
MHPKSLSGGLPRAAAAESTLTAMVADGNRSEREQSV